MTWPYFDCKGQMIITYYLFYYTRYQYIIYKFTYYGCGNGVKFGLIRTLY